MKLTLLLSALAGLAICSCSSTNMKVEANPVAGVDYSAYKTYKWVPLDQEASKNFTEKDRRVRAAFEDETNTIMSRRGFKKVESGKSDLIVYARGVRMAGYRSVGPTPAYQSSYAPNDDGAAWLASSPPATEGYLKAETSSSIRFLISEPDSDRVVWRGKAFVSFDNKRKQPLLINDAREVARKLLTGFPPKN
jgi:hypothetical protein